MNFYYSLSPILFMTCYRPECQIGSPCKYCGGKQFSDPSKTLKKDGSSLNDD